MWFVMMSKLYPEQPEVFVAYVTRHDDFDWLFAHGYILVCPD